MSLFETLQSDLKDAMRSGDTLRRDTLRLLISACKNQRIELGRELKDNELMAVLAKQVKSRQDSVEQYTNAGRTDLATQEQAEIDVIQAYLPKQLSEEETRAIVEGAIAKLGLSSKKDLGQLMKAVLAEHKGVIDGKTVQRLAAELLD